MPDPHHTGKEGERVSDRTFQVLGAIRGLGDGPHALRAIVGRTTLSRSTVQRHIVSGLRNGFIRQPSHGHYALADEPENWTIPAHQALLAPGASKQSLAALSRESGHTASLHVAVLTDVPMQMCVARQSETADPQLPHEELGSPHPLDADAAGLAILAHLDLPHTDLEQRQAIRCRGWVASAGPAAGTLMIAAPIIRFGVPVGSLSLIGLAEAFRSTLPHCVGSLRRAVTALSRAAVQPAAGRSHRTLQNDHT
ncbi:hypothetical protein ABZY31_21880 [Streptomyces sp. NPDC006529]|uniref:hypothetical protein n=1 Tax=Streptomyces sp. NPDC006529 TaxID=3157177 RepID=UPI0033AF6438